MKNLLKCMFITLVAFMFVTSISAQNAPGWDEGVAAIKLMPVKKGQLSQETIIFIGNIPSKQWSNPKNLYTNIQQNIFIRVLGGDKLVGRIIKLSKPALKVLKQNKNLKAFLVDGYVTFFDEKAVQFDPLLKDEYLKYKLQD